MNSLNKFVGTIALLCAMVLSNNNAFSQSFNQGSTYSITVRPDSLLKNTVEIKIRCLIAEAAVDAPDGGDWYTVSAVWSNKDSSTQIVIRVPILGATNTKEGEYYFFNYLLELSPQQFAMVTTNPKLSLKRLSKA